MEPFLVLFAGVAAGGCLVMFFYPQVAFRPIDDDAPPEAIGRARWMFLGMSLLMLSQGVRAAGELAGMFAGVRLSFSTVFLAAGIATMAWSIRGMRRSKHERLRMMRERHAAELRDLAARDNQPAD